MSGDGLLDIVEVGNGSVSYWPNLGGGRFGNCVAMANPPMFDHDAAFDSGRLRFADLDGSGTSDLIYLGRGSICFWINASGNGFQEGVRLDAMPFISDAARVEVLDFLADGTQCLVWSSPLPDDADAPLKFLPLTAGLPPRLLESVDGGLGKENRFVYGNTAAHYLRDENAGRPWVTKLPSHLTTVDEHHVIDQIGGGRQVTRFAYRDGFFDGEERRFRGFGQVDRIDSNQFGPSDGDNIESFAPPSCERMWFFVGKFGLGARRGATYYAGDLQAARLTEPEHETLSNLSPAEFEDGFRAAAGQLLRQETFRVAPDGSLAEHPFSTTEYGVRVRRIQPEHPGHHAVFMAYRSETLTHHYEEQPDDPNVSHHVILAVDEGGETTRHITIAYPRRDGADAMLPEQRQLFANLGCMRFLNPDAADCREFGLPVETQDFELVGLPRPAGRAYRLSELAALVEDAMASPLAFHETPQPAVGAKARLISWTRSYFWNEDRSEAAPFGTAPFPALLHHEEEACFTPELIDELYGDRVTFDMLERECRYKLADGHWWQADAVTHYMAPAQFLCVDKIVRSDGATTFSRYDEPCLLRTVDITDAVGNRVTATLDYHTLDPVAVNDENDNVVEALVDPLGMTVALSRFGTVLDKQGRTVAYGADPIADYHPVPQASVAEALEDSEKYLQTAMKVFVYEAERWRDEGLPPRSMALEREALVHDGDGGGDTGGRARISVTYYDGCTRPMQVKQRTDPGPAIERDADGRLILNEAGELALTHSEMRYAASGRVSYDHKQMPVREHQPYFSPTAEFEQDGLLQNLGASTVTRYDAIGRVVRVDYPDGTFTKIEATPWLRREYDQNDTVHESTYKALREPLSDQNPEKQALHKALAHADTPKLVHLNGRGEEIRIVEQGGEAQDRVTSYRLDGKGQQIALIDPRGLTAFTYRYDMVGRSLGQVSIDAGESTNLPDADDRTLLIWDGRGHRLSAAYDPLDRPVTLTVREPSGAERTVERLVYGDTGGITDAKQRNARSQMVARYDPAGIVEVDAFAPEGTPLRYARLLSADHRAPVDWSDPHAIELADETFETKLAFDALERPVSRVGADGVTRRFAYAASGALAGIKIKTADGVFDDLPLLEGTDVNERGQRCFSRLGNGVELSFDFDPMTFRVTRALANRGGAGAKTHVQDLRYTYDPAGQVIRADDRAQSAGNAGSPIRGLAVPAVCDYTYDAFNQLTRATGRVHKGLVSGDATNSASFMFSRRAGLNDGAAIERYTRNYSYDASGNLKRMRHAGASASWTDKFWVSDTSNRALPALDPNGTPVSNPEDRFDAGGNTTTLSHIARIDWDYSAQIERAVIIDRSDEGRPDDVETYVYGADRDRVRRITERLLGSGELEVVDKIYLDDIEITRIYQADELILERVTSQFEDSGQRIATLDQWSRDDRGRETDDVRAKSLRYPLSDALGSSVLELDATGEIVGYEEFFPYGGTAFVAGDNVRTLKRKDRRHVGKERDAATGLYYYGQRYFAPWTGRWLSPDPAGPVDGSNLYQFVRNNPINRVDPDGLDSGSGDSGYDTHRISNLPESFRSAWNKLTPAQQQRVKSGEMHLTQDGRVVTPAEAKRLAAESLKRHGKRGRIYVHIPGGHSGGQGSVGGGSAGDRAANAVRQQLADMMAGTDFGDLTGGFDISDVDPSDYTNHGAGDFGSGDGGDGDATDPATAGSESVDEAAGTAQSDSVSGDGSLRAGGTDGGTAADADGSTGTGTVPDGTGGAGLRGSGAGAGLAGIGGGGGRAEAVARSGGLGSAGIGSGGGRGQGAGLGNRRKQDATGGGALGTAAGGTGGQATGSAIAGGGDPAGVDWGVAGASGDPQQDPPDTSPPASERPPEQGGTSHLPPSEGVEPAPPDLARNGDDPKGSLSGSLDGTSGARGDQANEHQAGGSEGTGSADTGSVKGNPAGRESGTVVGNGQNGEEPNTLDKATRIAGYANLEFEDKPGGESGGAPGGTGSTNLGWLGPVLYIGLSIAAILGIGKLIKMFKVPLKAAIKAIGSKLLSAVKAPARLLVSMWRNAGYRRTLYREFRKRHMQLAKSWWQRHSIEVGVTKGAIPYAGHWGWRTGGQAFEAAGSKPVGYLFDAFYRSEAKWAFREAGWKGLYKEVFKRQFVGIRSARKIFKNGFGFRVPALNPGRAASFASKEIKVFSCWTSTWNAFSRANYHLPNGMVGVGLYKGYDWLFGGGEDGASGGGKQDRSN
ncbi:MAG: toxin TcdB middle/C-terminal domain-containing protein [Pseudomonadota bacterium]